MNKEKEIKDICKLICATCAQFDGCAINCKAHRDTAEALYNAGYRKIPEDNIRETVEKPVDTQKREYENIDDIARGFVVKDGKLMFVTNILDGYRHEFKDIHEICDELNNDMKEIDRLIELNNHLRFQLDELKTREVQAVKEFAEKLKEYINEYEEIESRATYKDITTYRCKFAKNTETKDATWARHKGFLSGLLTAISKIDELLKEYEK